MSTHHGYSEFSVQRAGDGPLGEGFGVGKWEGILMDAVGLVTLVTVGAGDPKEDGGTSPIVLLLEDMQSVWCSNS